MQEMTVTTIKTEPAIIKSISVSSPILMRLVLSRYEFHVNIVFILLKSLIPLLTDTFIALFFILEDCISEMERE